MTGEEDRNPADPAAPAAPAAFPSSPSQKSSLSCPGLVFQVIWKVETYFSRKLTMNQIGV